MNREQILGKKRIDWGRVNLERLLNLPERKRFDLIARHFGIDGEPEIVLISGGFNQPPAQLYYIPFAGYFIKLNEGNLIGILKDVRGLSDISGGLVQETRRGETQHILRIDQKYKRGKGLVEYTFKIEGDAWIGTYSSERYGKGQAICSIQSMGDLLDSRNARYGG